MNVHFCHSGIDRTLAAYPFFKAGWIKTAISRLRDGQLNLALKRFDGARFEPVGMVSSQIRTLIRACVEIVLTFHFHCFIEKHLHDFTQPVKTFFRNDLQNRLRHAKFFHCDKSFRSVLFSGKVNKAVRRTYHIFFANSSAASHWHPLRFYRKFVTQTSAVSDKAVKFITDVLRISCKKRRILYIAQLNLSCYNKRGDFRTANKKERQ